MTNKKYLGFTLAELIVVIIIIGILAVLAVPQFGSSQERALGREAVANLKLIAAAERIYQMETNVFYSGTDPIAINTNLKLFLNETNWDYTITVPRPEGPANSFSITAARQGEGGSLDCQYSFADNDADGEPDPNTSCP